MINTNYNQDVAGALSLITVNGSTYQIGKDASASEGGIAKLYTTINGQNTDGSVTQAAINAAIAEATGDASQVASDLAAYQTSNDAAVAANATAISNEASRAQGAETAINNKIGTIAEGSTVAGLISAEQTRAQGVESDLSNYITANAQAITTLNGDASTTGSVAKAVKDAINGVVDGADSAFDTLKEISDWITADQTGAAAILADVANKKVKQTAVADPTTGNATNAYEFIATISQNANGDIAATKQAVRSASATQSGLMSSADYSKLAAISASVSGDTLTITTAAA